MMNSRSVDLTNSGSLSPTFDAMCGTDAAVGERAGVRGDRECRPSSLRDLRLFPALPLFPMERAEVLRLLQRTFLLTLLVLIGSWAVAAQPDTGDAITEPAPIDFAQPDVTPPSPTAELPTPDTESMAVGSSEAEVLLEEALAAMDQVVLELDNDDPTTAAVQNQQLAVDRLKELLEAASQSPSSNNSSSKSKKTSSSKDPSDPQNEQPSESNSSDPNGSGGRRADDQNSAESSENVAGPMTPGSGVLAPGARGNSVWGHLPAREQESLLRSLSDTFLPEYEAQIRRYYEALAERK